MTVAAWILIFFAGLVALAGFGLGLLFWFSACLDCWIAACKARGLSA